MPWVVHNRFSLSSDRAIKAQPCHIEASEQDLRAVTCDRDKITVYGGSPRPPELPAKSFHRNWCPRQNGLQSDTPFCRLFIWVNLAVMHESRPLSLKFLANWLGPLNVFEKDQPTCPN
jgi:hypothetical protein